MDLHKARLFGGLALSGATVPCNKAVKLGVKVGAGVPRDTNETGELDRINQNNMWKQTIDKEVSKVKAAFQLLNDAE